MKLALLFALCLTLVQVQGSFWNPQDDSQDFLRAKSSQFSLVQNQAPCFEVSWGDRTFQDGGRVPGNAVRVCQESSSKSGLCYFTSISKCCSPSGLEIELVKETLLVGSKKVQVTILAADKGGDVCFSFDHQVSQCPHPGQCVALPCELTNSFCTNNSIRDSCDPSGCSSCKVGYTPDDCCECDVNYRKIEGRCKEVCQIACKDFSCSECKFPFTNPPTCCDCLPTFEKRGGRCVCPENHHLVGERCEPICTENTLASCSNPPCCKPGFKPPLCCECIYDESGRGDSFFESGNECKPLCTSNAFAEHCSVDRGCTSCQDSFHPPDCCGCRGRKVLVNGVCSDCVPGQILVRGMCKVACLKNVVSRSCTGNFCQCQPGYTGEGCCLCASGYIMEGGRCQQCPPGQKPGANQEKCICDQSQGLQIMTATECQSVCSEHVSGQCSESSCSCQRGFASPTCCQCTDGSNPKNNQCPLPCINNQDIFIVMERTTGIGNYDLYESVYMIEVLTGALMRGTNNLAVTVLSYADETSNILRTLSPEAVSGHVGESDCTTMLYNYETKIVDAFQFGQKPDHTYAGETMERLKSFLRKGVPTTVITFSGTTSDNPARALQKINAGIKAIQNSRAVNNKVKFFSVGYFSETVNGDAHRIDEYESEVRALGENKQQQVAIDSSDPKQTDTIKLFKKLISNLYNEGVLCNEQKNAIDKAVNGKFLENNYLPCLSNRVRRKKTNNCMRSSQYNGCKREKSSMLETLMQLIQELSA